MTEVASGYRWTVLAVCFNLLLLISYVDYLTGYDLLFFIFYFAPVCLCAWNLKRGDTLFMAVLCGLGWLLVDCATDHRYANWADRYWNAATCFLAFAGIGYILHCLRQSLREQIQAREELARALAELQQSTEDVRKLQANLQVVCAWTKRIRIDGKWIPLDEFLSSNLHIKISHGMSPEAFEAQMKHLIEDEGRPD